MSHNSFGHLFRVTTFGESHGPALAGGRVHRRLVLQFGIDLGADQNDHRGDPEPHHQAYDGA